MAFLGEEDSAVLAAVEDASRRLRRCRKRHPSTASARSALAGASSGRGMAAVSIEQRDCLLVHAASARARRYPGSNGAWWASMAQATASRRSATPRRVRPIDLNGWIRSHAARSLSDADFVSSDR